MKKTDWEILGSSPLFDGVDETDLPALLGCLSARRAKIPAGGDVLRAGDPAGRVGLVLTGQVQVIQDDFYGNRSIVASVGPGQLFGEAFACAGAAALPVGAVAAGDSEILWIDYRKILSTCEKRCAFHHRLIYNMLRVLAGKNMQLSRKVELLSKRTTREKLLCYLDGEARRAGSRSFSIPFSRQELADFLSVDRSAMCHELSKLRREGRIDFQKNRFTLPLG